MTETEESLQHESVQESLRRVVELLRADTLAELLARGHDRTETELAEALALVPELAELQGILDELHPADVAYVLEALPLNERLLVWDLVRAERDGEILLEVSDAVRETLIASMDTEELRAAAEQLDTDEIADLAPDLPQEVVDDVFKSLDREERAQLQSALSYPENTVGSLMDFDMVTIREDVNLEVVLRYLRRLGELPGHTDKLFVVDRDHVLKGVLPLKRLLVHDPDVCVAAVMSDDPVVFYAGDEASEAAAAFERYDLVSAPVVDSGNGLVGRLTVNTVVDFIREEAESDVLARAGLREEEDLFATVWQSARNRWMWLAVNLVTAFVASRVIGLFEGTIEKLVALAALMPIVAGIGGNSGNQTTTLIIRALALGQISVANARKMITKEIGVSLLNGLVWGSIVGMFAYLLYRNAALGVVMAAAMLLNLLVAALSGIFIPLVLHKMGRDPALGSSVLLTATTDSMGFFIFLGLATIFLL